MTGIDERFVGDDPIGTIRPKFVRGAHGDVQPKSTLLCDDAGERLVFEVVEQPNIFGVSGNIGYLFGEKPRIDRMTDRTNGGDGEVRFKMTVVIPGKGCHTITALDAGSQQRARKSPHATFQSCPIGVKEGSVAAPRDHRGVGVIKRGVD